MKLHPHLFLTLATLGLAPGGLALGSSIPWLGLPLLALGLFGLLRLCRQPVPPPQPVPEAAPAPAPPPPVADRTSAVEAMATRIEAEAGEAVAEVNAAARDLQAELDQLETSGMELEHQMQAARGDSERGAAEAAIAAEATDAILKVVQDLTGEVSRAAATSRAMAERGEEAQRLVAELLVAAGEINAVTRLIAGIAGQTNLLALNATIEAARAGEAGKGFAVVAGEVKQLAAEAAKANAAIAERIAAVLDRVTRTTQAVDTILAGVRDLAGISATVEQAMSLQAETAASVARAAEDASRAAQAATAKVVGAAAKLDDNRMSIGMMHGTSGQVAAAIDGLQGRLVGLVRATLEEGDRRHYPRIPVRCRCTVLPSGSKEAVAGQVANLSLGGAKVYSRAAVASGDLVRLTIDGLPDFACRVVGMSDGLQLAFVFPDTATERELQSRLKAFLSALQSEAA
ncbi:PilZ domain-containing protein [Belnapia sp. T18]|uniref:PilZ domain-containing protein n=1 Tax=Belnapia arida TaxID=2804533 RepID=A0ABS1U331_9PROT|nr:methyl-accepting chemotaxis protein [Belnapia arida]MBL6078580.1 PilZ domain-containing protein [Belnapia arida]